MGSKGWTWGVVLVCAATSVGACDDDGDEGGAGGGAGEGAAGEGAQAGMPSGDAGGPPDQTGGSMTSGGNGGGQAGQAGDRAGGAGGAGGEAGSTLGGTNGNVPPPRPLSCADGGASGADSGSGSAGEASEGAYRRFILGSEQIAIALNDSGRMLVTAGWGDKDGDGSDSCQAWTVDVGSVHKVEATEGGCILAVDLNEAGTVLASRDGSLPFLWKDGVATPLAGVASGWPVALNDSEQVLLRDTPVGPALWQAGTLTPLRTPTDEALVPVAINESGQVIGASTNAANVTETWLWEAGTATALGLASVHALNNLGDVAGIQTSSVGILSEGTFTPLTITSTIGSGPDLTQGDLNDVRVHAITDDGVLVGDFYSSGEPDLAYAFRFEAGAFRYLHGFGSARDVNAHDEIVGRRSSIGSCSGLECWTVDGYWSTLWVHDCPSACCAP